LQLTEGVNDDIHQPINFGLKLELLPLCRQCGLLLRREAIRNGTFRGSVSTYAPYKSSKEQNEKKISSCTSCEIER
jgi:hypothetical protein